MTVPSQEHGQQWFPEGRAPWGSRPPIPGEVAPAEVRRAPGFWSIVQLVFAPQLHSLGSSPSPRGKEPGWHELDIAGPPRLYHLSPSNQSPL